MPSYLCISFRFLQPLSHGRGDDGEPQWPPSPLRVYQALVAASAARWNERARLDHAASALKWLERQSNPVIVAAPGRRAGVKYRLYVPDNVADKVASSWARGGVASIADYRTEKDVCPVYVDGDAVHYLFPVADSEIELETHQQLLALAARSVTHLGWGIDMVVANAEIITQEQADSLHGERWQPVEDSHGLGLRVPVEGTLDALIRRHEAFLNRLGSDGFKPVPPLSAFRVVGYRRATEPAMRHWVAFKLLKPDATGTRAFEIARRTREVAGMVRCGVAATAKRHGWCVERINVFVHGKSLNGSQPARGEESPDRFIYLPLPTINHALRRVESIRRVLIAAPAHCQQEISWARRAMAGELLTSEIGNDAAILSPLPNSDWVLGKYVGWSDTWSTVTPVILPRHEGYAPAEADEQVKLAFEQAGYSRDLLRDADLSWRRVGFLAGTDLASRYLPPEKLMHKPRYHVRVRFPHPISGPVVVGAGRFRGFGLFAVDD